ncbi:MAG: phosphohydrolase, partial [Romboutsia sp.]
MSNKIKRTLMIMKQLYKDGNTTVYSLSNKDGYIKAKIQNKEKLEIGQIIEIEYSGEAIVDVSSYKIITNYKSEDYLPISKMDIEDIMNKINKITNEYIVSPQAVKLNNYFFQDEEFL